jgi:integrase
MAVERRKLTAAFITGIKPPAQGRIEIADEACSGLYLRVSEHGTKSFTCVFWQGRTIRCTLGKHPAWTLEAARRQCRLLAAKIAAGVDIAARQESERTMLTLGELYDSYSRDRAHAGRRGLVETRQMAERWFLRISDPARKKFGAQRVKPAGSVDWSLRRIDTITARDVAVLGERMKSQGISGATVNRVMGLLRAVYGYAKRARIFEGNPAEGFARGEERARTRFLTSEELPAFLAALESAPEPWHDFFMCLLLIGYRRAAMASMEWRHVDLEQGLWFVPVERSKNGEPVTLPVVGEALAILRRRKECSTSPYVFPSERTGKHVTSPKSAWAAVVKRAGLDDLHLHDLRRSLGSHLAMSGHSLPEIGRVLGHKSASSTQVYARLQLSSVATASAKAQERMLSLAKVVVPLTRKTG